MEFLASVFAICVLNSAYLLESILGYAEEIHEIRGLKLRDQENDLWCDLMVKMFFLSLNLAGCWMCLFRILSRS